MDNKKYKTFDIIQKRYDYAKEIYTYLLDDIGVLWDQVLSSYIENENKQDNGFLQKIKNNMVKGQKDFYNFILEKSVSAKLVKNEYYDALYCLQKYLKENPNVYVEDSLYYWDKIDDCIETIKDGHIELLKNSYGENWDYEKEQLVEDVYEQFL